MRFFTSGPDGIVNLFIGAKFIDELKRGKTLRAMRDGRKGLVMQLA
jgi:hypothetical protein